MELWQQSFLRTLATPAAGLFLEGSQRAVTLPYTLTIPCLLLCFAKSWNCSQSPSQALRAKQWLSCKELLVWPFWSQEPPGKASTPRRGSLLSAVGKGWSRSPKPPGVSLTTAASSSSSFSLCPLDPSFGLVCHLYLNPYFYDLNPSFYLLPFAIVLSPVPAVLVLGGEGGGHSKSGRSLIWARHQLSRCGSTEAFPRISLLLVLGNLPSEMCLLCWELMLWAGN